MSLSDVVKKVVEAPRRLRERGEEIGQDIKKTYHEKREMTAEQSARQTYNERYKENREKLAKGTIDRETYERRQKGYSESMKEESNPIEQRVAKTTGEVVSSLSRGTATAIHNATHEGDKSIYRGMGSVQFGNVARSKRSPKTKSPAQKPVDFSRSPINFGNGTSLSGIGLNNPLFGGSLGLSKRKR